MALKEQDVSDFLKKWVASYEAGDKAFFDAFDPSASFFSVSSPTRIDGVEEFRRGFEEQFLGQQRRSQVLSPEIRVIGDAALVSYHNRVSVGGGTANLRATLVVVNDPAGLKIAHLHTSPLASVGVSVQGRAPEAVTLPGRTGGHRRRRRRHA
ncbi:MULTISPECIES: nuclear transport factor 2 family protein [Bradyrhizobium]|jgi:ketosteroid isomerase-like protein|uniref:nuclear transport factor 2 family protein n=1 Tax=Bradyrhizobium TaxID=374 RepID=UPI000488075B|nr:MULTISPECIES: nuclear transport factor 2 family protein [Bradyrhizobium]MCS3566478.1 ketosteroid isomerase-like protein [Bradyrhizobium elkanii]MCW2152793.1 ketosteroid isomerase-like protein [Bradyrhizobium elkanii]MCW2376525.1 ketosteroid isomerase-like protein [Bradyrhizobium elkanii]MDI2110690.1 nuclear transport factor 2 family protein [Bradyrhizobium sp. Mp64]WLC10443.1 nuclear transport factor 2 family protein [Bradyrhizobium elkanii USDA 94]